MKVLKLIANMLEDILILSGLAVIVITTFFISKFIGFYLLGFVLFGLGIYFSKYPLKRR